MDSMSCGLSPVIPIQVIGQDKALEYQNCTLSSCRQNIAGNPLLCVDPAQCGETEQQSNSASELALLPAVPQRQEKMLVDSQPSMLEDSQVDLFEPLSQSGRHSLDRSHARDVTVSSSTLTKCQDTTQVSGENALASSGQEELKNRETEECSFESSQPLFSYGDTVAVSVLSSNTIPPKKYLESDRPSFGNDNSVSKLAPSFENSLELGRDSCNQQEKSCHSSSEIAKCNDLLFNRDSKQGQDGNPFSSQNSCADSTLVLKTNEIFQGLSPVANTKNKSRIDGSLPLNDSQTTEQTKSCQSDASVKAPIDEAIVTIPICDTSLRMELSLKNSKKENSSKELFNQHEKKMNSIHRLELLCDQIVSFNGGTKKSLKDIEMYLQRSETLILKMHAMQKEEKTRLCTAMKVHSLGREERKELKTALKLLKLRHEKLMSLANKHGKIKDWSNETKVSKTALNADLTPNDTFSNQNRLLTSLYGKADESSGILHTENNGTLSRNPLSSLQAHHMAMSVRQNSIEIPVSAETTEETPLTISPMALTKDVNANTSTTQIDKNKRQEMSLIDCSAQEEEAGIIHDDNSLHKKQQEYRTPGIKLSGESLNGNPDSVVETDDSHSRVVVAHVSLLDSSNSQATQNRCMKHLEKADGKADSVILVDHSSAEEDECIIFENSKCKIVQNSDIEFQMQSGKKSINRNKNVYSPCVAVDKICSLDNSKNQTNCNKRVYDEVGISKESEPVDSGPASKKIKLSHVSKFRPPLKSFASCNSGIVKGKPDIGQSLSKSSAANQKNSSTQNGFAEVPVQQNENACCSATKTSGKSIVIDNICFTELENLTSTAPSCTLLSCPKNASVIVDNFLFTEFQDSSLISDANLETVNTSNTTNNFHSEIAKEDKKCRTVSSTSQRDDSTKKEGPKHESFEQCPNPVPSAVPTSINRFNNDASKTEKQATGHCLQSKPPSSVAAINHEKCQPNSSPTPLCTKVLTSVCGMDLLTTSKPNELSIYKSACPLPSVENFTPLAFPKSVSTTEPYSNMSKEKDGKKPLSAEPCSTSFTSPTVLPLSVVATAESRQQQQSVILSPTSTETSSLFPVSSKVIAARLQSQRQGKYSPGNQQKQSISSIQSKITVGYQKQPYVLTTLGKTSECTSISQAVSMTTYGCSEEPLLSKQVLSTPRTSQTSILTSQNGSKNSPFSMQLGGKKLPFSSSWKSTSEKSGVSLLDQSKATLCNPQHKCDTAKFNYLLDTHGLEQYSSFQDCSAVRKVATQSSTSTAPGAHSSSLKAAAKLKGETKSKRQRKKKCSLESQSTQTSPQQEKNSQDRCNFSCVSNKFHNRNASKHADEPTYTNVFHDHNSNKLTIRSSSSTQHCLIKDLGLDRTASLVAEKSAHSVCPLQDVSTDCPTNVSFLINSLKTVLLISDQELQSADDYIPVQFWDEDFSQITMSQCMWDSVVDW